MESGINNNELDFPLITIIIGTKDRAKLLPRAINSVLNQTYIKFECIIVDGDSHDNTKEIVLSYEDSRIIYIRLSPNPGRGEALNYAMKISKGDFLVVLDDDDEFLPNKIENQVKLLVKSNDKVGLIYSWTKFWDDKKDKLDEIWENNIEGYVFQHLLESQSLCTFPAIMFKRNALLKIGYYFNRTAIDSDWQYVCRICKEFEVILYPEILQIVHRNHLYLRLSNQNIISKQRHIDLCKFHIDFLKEFHDDYKKHKKKQLVHIIPILQYSSYLKQYKLFIIYSIKAILINPFYLNTNIQILKGLIRILFKDYYKK
ncbi:MAG: glycosyltransferase [Bacteroidota bacterium]